MEPSFRCGSDHRSLSPRPRKALRVGDDDVRGGCRIRANSPATIQIYSFTDLNRNALAITLTDDSAMTAAAMIGERRMPKAG